MSLSIGASSNVLSTLQSLLTQGTAAIGDAASSGSPLAALFQSLSGASPAPQSPTTAGGSASPGSSFGADTMAALLSLQGQPAGGTTAQSPFAKLDSNGDGKIGKSEFESALGNAGVSASTADTVFDQLDTDGDGSISTGGLTSAKPGRGHHHHHMHAGGAAQGNGGQSASSSSSSSSNADGTTTQSTTNPDGSTTKTVTYADGSAVVTTTPAVAQMSGGTPGGASSQSHANLLEQLTQLQNQLLTVASSTLSSLV
jgi:hypothetical protein